ncbi:porin family protein [Ferruginibacter sp.]|nr:outer membrane beta-barrel protein [Ferruginibacter sp.]
MNNNQRFDDNIREQFENYTPQVHPRIWENIVKEREKRRPVGFWFTFFNGRNILLLAGLLLVAVSGAYLLSKKSALKQKEESINIAAAKQKANATITTANNNKEDNSNTETTGNTVSQTTTSPAANDNANKPGNSYSTLATTSSSKIKIYSPFVQSGEEEIATNDKLKKKNSTTSNNEYDISDADLANDNLTPRESYLKKLWFDDLQKIRAERQVGSLHKKTFPKIYLPDCPSIEDNAAGNKTYVELYGGPDMAFRSLSDTGNSAYLQKRKESTKFSSAFSAGLRITKVFNNGMSIRSGINYSQINEKFTFVQGNLVQITYVIDANGDTTGSYITTGTRYKTTINRYRTIDVPLLIGYEMGNGKFHTNINAGIIVNAYSWQKGDVLDSAYRPVSITTGKTSSPYQFKTNIGIGFMAGASFYYKLNEKIHLMAEPYFRYNLSPMSREKLTLTQKYNTAGLRLGLRVDLH